MSVAYGAGLRVAEVSTLKVADIDSERMLLKVERGKGGQYRNALLPADLLSLLRQWWTLGRQQGVMHRDGWLFPGQHALKPISTRQLHRIVVEAAHAAEIAKRVGPRSHDIGPAAGACEQAIVPDAVKALGQDAARHRRADRAGDVMTRHDPHVPYVLARQPRRSLKYGLVYLRTQLYPKIRGGRLRSNLPLPRSRPPTAPSDRVHAAASGTDRGCPPVCWPKPFLKTP